MFATARKLAQIVYRLVRCGQGYLDIGARAYEDRFQQRRPKNRCAAMGEDKKQALVLELFAQDLQAGLESAVRDKQQELVRFAENLLDKKASSLTVLTESRERLSSRLHDALQELGYAY